MAIVITKKLRTILLIILGVLVLGGGGYLLWRVNQEETVAPEDSEASECPADAIAEGYYSFNGYSCVGEIDGVTTSHCCVDDKWVTTMTGCFKQGACLDGQGWISYTAPVTKYTIKYVAGTGGSISGTATQTLAKDKTTSSVTAVADDGYTFTQWSDGSTSASRTDKVSGNATYTATFTANQYTVTYDANGGTCTPSTRTVDYGTISAAPTCTYTGFNLSGFKRTTGSGGTLDTLTGAITEVSGDQTIQALWSENCGDGVCSTDENANTCPIDCEADCGDGYCTHDEDVDSCPSDCDTNCGDGVCNGDETPENCSADCGSPVVPDGDSVPQTGIFDTVISKISLGVSFIFLGGLVSQYSRINYLFNSISEKNRFKKDIRREKKDMRRREKLEKRFK